MSVDKLYQMVDSLAKAVDNNEKLREKVREDFNGLIKIAE
jgi:hypothetical protein